MFFRRFTASRTQRSLQCRKSSTKAMQTFGMMKSLSPDELEEAREVLLDFLSKRPGTDEHTAAVEKLDVSQKSQNVRASCGCTGAEAGGGDEGTTEKRAAN